MKIFSAAQIRDWDKYTIKAAPIKAINLMERAGSACCKWIQQNIPATAPIIVCCGNGNNGGDGLVIARLLHKATYKVAVCILQSNKSSAEAVTNLKRLVTLKPAPVFIETTTDFPAITEKTVVIDALFGTGLNRPLKNLPARLVKHINEAGCTVISIDMPSGLCADVFSGTGAIIKATHTLSFETNKLAFLLPENAGFTGQVHLLAIGLAEKYYASTNTLSETIDPEMIKKIYRPRNAFTHKYSFGHALLYAGSKNMMGAAVLCSRACIRSGAGLATIHVSPGCEAIIHTALPEAITTTLAAGSKSWLKKSTIAAGPGMEDNAKNRQLIKKILAEWDGPLVLDATALSIVSSFTSLLPLRKLHPAILTPHTGEFDRLFGKTTNDFERMELAAAKAAAFNCYVILKGHYTLIACPDGQQFFNTTGNAGMATAGSGDTLTGILTGLLAQGYTEKEACLLGVYLHGLAGDIAAQKMSQEAMMASDITDCLGEGFKQISAYGN